MINIDFKDIEIMPLGYSSSGGGSSGGEIRNQSKSITIKENGTQSVTYDDGYTGLEQVNLNVDIDIPTFTTQNKVIDITENGLKTVTVDEGYDGITSIDINTNVKSGGGNSFECIGYSSNPQYIQDGIDYAQTIYDNWDASITDRSRAFSDDTQLVYCPLIDTSNVTNMKGMFSGCTKLWYFPSINIKSCTNTSFMFQNSKSLQVVEKLDTSNVTSMSYMFDGCSGLKWLDLSSFDTSNVTDMQGMFSECNLDFINSLSFNVSKVTNMIGMFKQCTFNNLDLSQWDLSNQVDLGISYGNMFYYSTGNTLNLSNWKFQGGFNGYSSGGKGNNGGMFSGCMIKEIILDNVDTSKVTDMYSMFYDCNSLTSLDLSSFDTSNVTSMQGMFAECSNLTSLDLSNFDTSNVTSIKEMFKNCTSLTKVNGCISLKSYSSSTMSNTYIYGYYTLSKLRKITFKDIGYKSSAVQFDNSRVTNWGVNDSAITDARQSLIDSLITYSFDRANAGYSACTVTLHTNSKALLTDDEIAAITAKGFTIA